MTSKLFGHCFRKQISREDAAVDPGTALKLSTTEIPWDYGRSPSSSVLDTFRIVPGSLTRKNIESSSMVGNCVVCFCKQSIVETLLTVDQYSIDVFSFITLTWISAEKIRIPNSIFGSYMFQICDDRIGIVISSISEYNLLLVSNANGCPAEANVKTVHLQYSTHCFMKHFVDEEDHTILYGIAYHANEHHLAKWKIDSDEATLLFFTPFDLGPTRCVLGTTLGDQIFVYSGRYPAYKELNIIDKATLKHVKVELTAPNEIFPGTCGIERSIISSNGVVDISSGTDSNSAHRLHLKDRTITPYENEIPYIIAGQPSSVKHWSLGADKSKVVALSIGGDLRALNLKYLQVPSLREIAQYRVSLMLPHGLRRIATRSEISTSQELLAMIFKTAMPSISGR